MLNNEESVYDFHEGSDGDDDGLRLSIDDTPRKQTKRQTATVTTGSLRIRLPAAVGSKPRKSRQDEQAGEVPKNGIETLIRASTLTQNNNEDGGGGNTSPSTEEAIVGMLSIGQTTYMEPGRSDANTRRYLNTPPSSPEDESLNNVHQDEDYGNRIKPIKFLLSFLNTFSFI